MITHKTWWLLVGLVCLALLPSCAGDEGPTWEEQIAAGHQAFELGDYPEAESQLEPALETAEAFGPQDPRLATSLNELALLYRHQGRYEEAEPLYKRALAIREKALGPDHPRVATVLNNLGTLYYAQDRYAEAEPLIKRALAIYEKALGADHPRVAALLENYAALLRKTGRGAEATKMKARAKAIRAKQARGNPAK
jgi:Tfp pilus assembly protein PilF